MGTYRIVVTLDEDREKGGQLAVVDGMTGLLVFGPISCLGMAARNTAEDHQNEGALSTKAYGDTPLGDYDVTGTLGPETAPDRIQSFGVYKRLTLKGVGGDANLREIAGPNQMRIHGGGTATAPDGSPQLRRTNGCIRISNWDMASLLQFLDDNGAAFPFRMTVSEGTGMPIVSEIQDDNYLDPDY
ncbi:L,D-transpeptidase [Paraburkholderia caribensis]|uniref:L,D-transpeptidase n=1 Tax=Paraburkholderia caribensis TaxID=75105 RepID=UPI00285B8CCB|nr:L,D-transpeptidase family protein [Paraburkholderia caribensis]MDR6384010.1 hypothetical protein [Paraburkholderia caribensis]